MTALGATAVLQANGVTYSGRAIGVLVSSKALDGKLTVTSRVSDTGDLPSTGGVRNASLLTAKVKGVLTAGIVQAAAIGQGDRSRSEAAVANANVTFAGLNISATLISAQAQAVCTDTGPSVSGHSQLLSLKVNGSAVNVTGAPNQTVLLVGAGGEAVTLVINEQIVGPDSITVNAIHLSILQGTVADVIVAQAHADIQCSGTPVCTKNQDYVTGFGHIDADGARGEFAFAAGIKPNGALIGHLNFNRVGGISLKGQCIYSYEILDEVTRRFGMTVCLGKECGYTAVVTVEDNANPDGTGLDRFTIEVSNGVTYSGLLQAGNIQIHEPCK